MEQDVSQALEGAATGRRFSAHTRDMGKASRRSLSPTARRQLLDTFIILRCVTSDGASRGAGPTKGARRARLLEAGTTSRPLAGGRHHLPPAPAGPTRPWWGPPLTPRTHSGLLPARSMRRRRSRHALSQPSALGLGRRPFPA